MKISELLEAIGGGKSGPHKGSRLPSAKSLNDPRDSDSEEGDKEDNNGNIDDIKKVGGDIADNDLYSITVYNTTEEFAEIEPITKPTWVLEDFDNPVVKDYLDQSSEDISNNKTISCVIYNARNGEFFRFDSGSSGSGFKPAISQLVSDGIIDSDQTGPLNNIESIGREYSKILDSVIWNSGEVAEGTRRAVDNLYNTLSRLKDALNLREFRETIHNVYISPEQKQKNKEYTDDSIEAWKKYKEEKKTQGPGREKR